MGVGQVGRPQEEDWGGQKHFGISPVLTLANSAMEYETRFGY